MLLGSLPLFAATELHAYREKCLWRSVSSAHLEETYCKKTLPFAREETILGVSFSITIAEFVAWTQEKSAIVPRYSASGLTICQSGASLPYLFEGGHSYLSLIGSANA